MPIQAPCFLRPGPLVPRLIDFVVQSGDHFGAESCYHILLYACSVNHPRSVVRVLGPHHVYTSLDPSLLKIY